MEASELVAGDYKAVTQLKNKTEIISSSNTSFSVTDLISVNDNFKGAINVNKNSDKEQLFKYFVTNIGNSNVYNSTVRISVYKANGEKINDIDKQVDISVGETIELSEIFNTEALKIDTYPVVLSIITEEGEEIILANSGFEITKINSYTVTFLNLDGTVIDTQSVEYGKSAITPIIDDNIINGNYKYEFTGWDSDFSYITKDLTVKAVYKKTEISGNSEKEPETTDKKITKNNESVDTGDKFNVNLLIILIVSFVTVILIKFNKKEY